MLISFVVAGLLLNFSILFWLPITCLSLLSLFGDRINLIPTLRLTVQFTVAALFFISIAFFRDAENGGQSIILIVFSLLFSIYIVGTANFFNFMDGINGIAGITGVVGFGLIGAYGVMNQQNSDWVILSFVMGFSCIGFLPFNVPKARVFMGDVGSILLGFVFACMVVAFTQTFSDFVILVSFMFPFYIDELTTMVERIADKQSLTLPHRRHLYQVLANEAEIAHWKVSIGYGIAQLLIGLSVWYAVSISLFLGMVTVGMFIIAFVIVNMKVKKKWGCWIGKQTKELKVQS